MRQILKAQRARARARKSGQEWKSERSRAGGGENFQPSLSLSLAIECKPRRVSKRESEPRGREK